MNLGLLGDDSETLQLADVAAQRGWKVAVACDVTDPARLGARFPGVSIRDDWASLLDNRQVDVVLVGAADDEERRADQAVRLAQASVPLIVAHPLCTSAIVYYQLDMIRRETNGLLLPLLAARWQPAIAELRSIVAGSTTAAIGNVEQFVIERPLANRDRRHVLSQFARDADIVRYLFGDVTRLAAMGPPIAAKTDAHHAPTYASLSVSLTTHGGVLVRWSTGSPETLGSAMLTLLGTHGKATLALPADGPWRLTSTVADGGESTREYPPFDLATVAWERLESARRGDAIDVDWLDAARAVDLANTIDDSLRRRRAMDILDETYSETQSFKGAMGIAGCGLLLFGLFSVVLAAILQMIARHSGAPGLAELLGKWPYALGGLFAVFLLLQLLRLLIPKQ